MKRNDWPFLVIVFALPFFIYLPTLSGWFLGDDYGFFPIFKMSADNIMKCIKMVHEGELRLHPFRPVAFFSLWLDYRIWGWNSLGFHFTNSLLHSLNALLIYFLVKNLRMSKTAALITALFYGLYPGHSEAVVWICCRFDLLSQFLFLFSLLFWIKGREKKNSRWMISSALFFLLSLFSKETVAGGIVLFPLIDWLFLRHEPIKMNYKFWVGWVGVQFGVLMVLILMRIWLFGNLSGDVGVTRGDQFCGTSVTQCIDRLWGNLWILLTPVSRLIFSDFLVFVAGAIIIFFSLVAIWKIIIGIVKKDYLPLKWFVLGISWIILLVSPTLFVSPVLDNLDGSRFLYMSCTGLAMIIGISITQYSNNFTKWFFNLTIILYIIWLLMSSTLLWQYNNASWVEAGRVVKDVDQIMYDSTQNIESGDTIVVINLPWLWKGAHFAPNGYSAYLQEIHQKRYITLTYVEKNPSNINQVWLSDLQQAQNRNYYVFLWDESNQILQTLVTH